MYKKKNINSLNLLDTDNLVLRENFKATGSCIGMFQAKEETRTAHVLHSNPLIIGTFTSQDSGHFYPDSPPYQGKSVECTALGRHDSGYTAMQCKSLGGETIHLEVATPSLAPGENLYKVGYSEGTKCVSKEHQGSSMAGGIVSYQATSEFFSVLTEDSEVGVEELAPFYEKLVWPVANLYFKKLRQKYFTYFRECEALKNQRFSGSEGNRARTMDFSTRWAKFSIFLSNLFK